MISFWDSHCHLYEEYYDNIDNIINLSTNNNVNFYINNGCDINSNIEVLKMSQKYENLYSAIGIHPENVNSYKNEDLDFIEKHIKDKKVIAIGEIGLDYHYDKKSKYKQIKLFEYQLSLAEKYNMPVVIHSREATQDTLDIIKKYNVKGVIHSFSGSYEIALEYLKKGFYFGVNGVITFKNSNIKDIIVKLPLDKILLETDSPYLTPHPNRGKQNNPSYIKDIAIFVADLFNISLEELSKITNNNINDLFFNCQTNM